MTASAAEAPYFSAGEVFEEELASWCKGLYAYPGDLSKEVVYAVVKEMNGIFKLAVEQGHPFDLLKVAKKINHAARNVLSEEELVFFISLLLPHPDDLFPESLEVLAIVLDKASTKYQTLMPDLEGIWNSQKRKTLMQVVKEENRVPSQIRL